MIPSNLITKQHDCVSAETNAVDDTTSQEEISQDGATGREGIL